MIILNLCFFTKVTCTFLLQENMIIHRKRQHFSQYWTDKCFKGNVGNLALSSLHGGSLEITRTEAEFKEFEPRLKYGWFHFNCIEFSRFKPALNWNRFMGDLRRRLNSFNSDTGATSWTWYLNGWTNSGWRFCVWFLANTNLEIQDNEFGWGMCNVIDGS